MFVSGRILVRVSTAMTSVLSASKRSKTSQQSLLKRSKPPSRSKPATINDLPDLVLVEILCRLPHNEFVCECKRVSKRWLTLLSNPYFISRFLRLQHDHQKPVLKSFVIVPQVDKRHQTLFLGTTTTSSKLPPPVFKTSILSFLPCFQNKDLEDRADELDVVGIYNDLVLCCSTMYSQRDYYICNPYTKQWVRLPPTPHVSHSELKVPVGFICDPYYKEASNSSIIELNAEYRWRVVRILPNSSYALTHLEIFSSETGEWREYEWSKVICPSQKFTSFCKRPGVAYNGKLYWWNRDGFSLELDPFNISSTGDIVDNCRFIDAPKDFGYMRIGVCQDRLRMYPLHIGFSLSIWELKENRVDGKMEWCLIFDRLPLSKIVSKDPLITEAHIKSSCVSNPVGFHRNDKDILYLTFREHIVMCNIREKTLEVATKISWGSKYIYQFVLPWWPTPVPKIDHATRPILINTPDMVDSIV